MRTTTTVTTDAAVIEDDGFYYSENIKLDVPTEYLDLGLLHILAKKIKDFQDENLLAMKELHLPLEELKSFQKESLFIISLSYLPFTFNIKYADTAILNVMPTVTPRNNCYDVNWTCNGQKLLHVLEREGDRILEKKKEEYIHAVANKIGIIKSNVDLYKKAIATFIVMQAYNNNLSVYIMTEGELIVEDINGVKVTIGKDGEIYTATRVLARIDAGNTFHPSVHEFICEFHKVFGEPPTVTWMEDIYTIKSRLNNIQFGYTISTKLLKGDKTLKEAKADIEKTKLIQTHLAENWVRNTELDDELVSVRILKKRFFKSIYVKSGEDIYHVDGLNPVTLSLPVILYKKHIHIFKRNALLVEDISVEEDYYD
jgi:hypothetical protein